MDQVINDPALVAKLAAQVGADKKAAKEVNTIPPVPTSVTLPVGLGYKGQVLRVAEVRELNGLDEEAIAKAPEGEALNVILSRGLVSIDGEVIPTKYLDNMYLADRDAILIGIYKVTFGPEVPYETICSKCGTVSIFGINLDTDVESVSSDQPSFEVSVKAGKVMMAIPNIMTYKKLTAQALSMAEATTAILEGCILTVNGETVYTASFAKELGMNDRRALISALDEHTPGPRLGEVTKACEACGESVETPLSLAALFRL